MSDTEFIEMRCCRIQFIFAGEPKGNVVQSDSVLVEAVSGDRPQPEQRAAEVVDDAAVQEAQLIAGGFVGIFGDFQQHRPTEHALVELARPLDIGHGQSDMCDGTTRERHSPHGSTERPHVKHATIAVVQIAMTMPVMEPDLDATVLETWARAIDEGPFSSLCWGERIAFDNPDNLTLLGALAAWTKRVRLLTTVIVPQLHDPVMLAKGLATGDLLSGGRLTVGIGVGAGTRTTTP